MPPDPKKLLEDALAAVRLIEQFSAGRELKELDTDPLLRSGIYWQFAIIGEALTQLRRFDPATFGQISESPRIIAFRNQILHGYGSIQDNVTWQIIQDKVPVLRRELEGLLKGP